MNRHCIANSVCTKTGVNLRFFFINDNLIESFSMTTYLFPPVAIPSLAIRGHLELLGKPVDKSVERPFYFTKAPQTLLPSGSTMAYPSETSNFHYEMEMVVALGKPGFRVSPDKSHELIYGYAAGLDMTRRDLQLIARDKGRPWDLGKDIEQGSVCSEIVPMPGHIIDSAAIELAVNGQVKQSSDVNKLIWNVRELIADLSLFYHLQPGDLIYTGTPEGVGAVLPGDNITGTVKGVADISLLVGDPY